MSSLDVPFTPTPDVEAILNQLLDVYERRDGAPKQAVRVKMEEAEPALPGYNNQTDPDPRLTTNEQLAHLAGRGGVYLTWQPGPGRGAVCSAGARAAGRAVSAFA
jgi:hypothetical protein